MIVMKFGGTSVEDAAAMRRAAGIVATREPRTPVVVVSAMAGVTTRLLTTAAQAAGGELVDALHTVAELRERHFRAAAALEAAGAQGEALRQWLGQTFDHLASLLSALAVLGHVPARSRDEVAAVGELVAARLFTAALIRHGIAAEVVDPRRVILTDASFGRATPSPPAIARAAATHVMPLLHDGRVPVLGGFVGGTSDGITTTLGRGGSDYTAALLGAAMDAEAIEIWTDVDGILTADPRVVPEARVVEAVHYDEAAELAAFGAKVLHPATIAPARDRGIPVFVLNSRRPMGTGTRIARDAPRRAVTAIAGRDGVRVVRVRSAAMLAAHGVLGRIFDVFARHRVAVDVVTTSEVSVSATVDAGDALAPVLAELSTFADVSVIDGCAVVAAVGLALTEHPRVVARATAALDGTAVHMLSVSATGTNLTAVVDGAAVDQVLRRLHAAVFEHADVPLPT